jgi:hypothetical protein
MKKILSIAIAAALAAPLSVFAADSVSWTNWTDVATGSLTQNSTIGVTLSGPVQGLSYDSYYWDHTAAFTSAEITNAPAAEGTIITQGGSDVVNHIHFSTAVVNPYLAIFSAGQSGHPVTFVFSNDASLSLLSGGPGHWGGQALTLSGQTVTGEEGNGVVKLTGSYQDIWFTTPQSENYYGFTVGAAVAAVPEPSTYAMMGLGLGLLGFAARRRKQA